jgi:hypothetical protein
VVVVAVRQIIEKALLVALVAGSLKLIHYQSPQVLLVKDTLEVLVLTVVVQTKVVVVAVVLAVLVVIGLTLERRALAVAEFHQASLARL